MQARGSRAKLIWQNCSLGERMNGHLHWCSVALKNTNVQNWEPSLPKTWLVGCTPNTNISFRTTKRFSSEVSLFIYMLLRCRNLLGFKCFNTWCWFTSFKNKQTRSIFHFLLQFFVHPGFTSAPSQPDLSEKESVRKIKHLSKQSLHLVGQ